MIIDGTRAHDRATTLILDYYAAFNRGDWAAMLALLTDDVAHDLNQGARETGRDAFAAFLARMDRSYREQLRDIVVMAAPDGVRATISVKVPPRSIQNCQRLPATAVESGNAGLVINQ